MPTAILRAVKLDIAASRIMRGTALYNHLSAMGSS